MKPAKEQDRISKTAEPAGAASNPGAEAAPRGAASAGEAAARLVTRYGPYPDESSGPVVDQLVWFMLSTRTTVGACEAAYRALRGRFSAWEEIPGSSDETLLPLLRSIGLAATRANNLRHTIQELISRFGSASLEPLRPWPDADCETFLLALPGVGLKVARCVMSFGLGRPVMAVDTHIWRVSRRLGWHDSASSSPTRPGVDAIQASMTPGLDVVSLHVNLIRLGREFCRPQAPRCGECPLAALCRAGESDRAGPTGLSAARSARGDRDGE